MGGFALLGEALGEHFAQLAVARGDERGEVAAGGKLLHLGVGLGKKLFDGKGTVGHGSSLGNGNAEMRIMSRSRDGI